MAHGVFALAFAALAFGTPSERAAGESVVASTSDIVAIEDLHATDTMVSGILVNRTDSQVENVALMVTDSFLWKDALHPGTDDPGNATRVVVAGPIPPRDSVPFRLDRTRPARPDGAFLTQVHVTGLATYETLPRRSDAR
jgi:hypothetical protein